MSAMPVQIPRPPEGFREIRRDHATIWTRPEIEAWVRNGLSAGERLYEVARAQVEGHAELEGRAPVFLLRSPPVDRVVRHYVRGGTIASGLGDRYLRVGVPRPFREAVVSEQLRALDVPTPQVLAAAYYPAGAFYRGDLITEYVPNGVDVAELLFGADDDPTSEPFRIAVLREVGRLVASLCAIGIVHPDLNLKNFLVQQERGVTLAGRRPPRIHLLDLDRCRLRRRGSSPASGRRMKRRVLRSLSKWERETSRPLTPAERRALEEELNRI